MIFTFPPLNFSLIQCQMIMPKSFFSYHCRQKEKKKEFNFYFTLSLFFTHLIDILVHLLALSAAHFLILQLHSNVQLLFHNSHRVLWIENFFNLLPLYINQTICLKRIGLVIFLIKLEKKKSSNIPVEVFKSLVCVVYFLKFIIVSTIIFIVYYVNILCFDFDFVFLIILVLFKNWYVRIILKIFQNLNHPLDFLL